MTTRYYDFTGNWNGDNYFLFSVRYNEAAKYSDGTVIADFCSVEREEDGSGFGLACFSDYVDFSLLRDDAALLEWIIEDADDKGWSCVCNDLKEAKAEANEDPQLLDLIACMAFKVENEADTIYLNTRKENNVFVAPYDYNAADELYDILFNGAQFSTEGGNKEIPAASYQLLVSGLEAASWDAKDREDFKKIREAVAVVQRLRDEQKRREWKRRKV